MPVTTFVTSAATFLYALSSLFSGAQNAVVQVPLALRSTDEQAFLPTAFPTYNLTSEYPQIQRRTSQAERLVDLKARARGLVTLLTFRPSLLGDRRQNGNGLSDNDHRLHDQHMAESIFQTLITHSYRHNASAGLLTDEITYYDKETVATIFLSPQGNVTRCRLIEVVEPEDAERVLQMIANKNKPIEQATFRTMLTIITACQALEPKTVTTTTSSTEASTLTETPFGEFNMPPDYNMWSIISGILPGTKWCGLGDISSSYDDLGPERNLDKCCRAHDHCPVKVKAFRSRYGLVNWSLYTKSHCECDSLLYDCLKKAGSPVAEMLGNFYFNVLRVQCVDEEEQSVCAARDPMTKSCKVWQPDSRQPKRMLFRTVRRQF